MACSHIPHDVYSPVVVVRRLYRDVLVSSNARGVLFTLGSLGKACLGLISILFQNCFDAEAPAMGGRFPGVSHSGQTTVELSFGTSAADEISPFDTGKGTRSSSGISYDTGFLLHQKSDDVALRENERLFDLRRID